MNGATLYQNGLPMASTASNDIGYVAMMDDSRIVQFAFEAGSSYFSGRIAGGPLGPFLVRAELTANDVLSLYDLGRLALGL